jgi:aminoglycoside phosphotransferase (APT) family kinase protein
VIVGEGIVVIDLDEARLGDPALDLAHFGTYLELRGASEPGADALSEAFLAEYQAAGGSVNGSAYVAFCAYSWLKIAKQAAVASGPWRGVPPDRRRAGMAAALTRGEECLVG